MPFSHNIGSRSRAKTGSSGGMPTSFRTRSYTGSSSNTRSGSLARSAAAAMPFSSKETDYDAFKVGSSFRSLSVEGTREAKKGYPPLTHARRKTLSQRASKDWTNAEIKSYHYVFNVKTVLIFKFIYKRSLHFCLQ